MRMYPEPTGEVRMSLSLRFAAGSHDGMIREHNEDSGYAGPRLLAVADGMGGQAAGEVASSEVISTMVQLDEDVPGSDILTSLGGTLQRANDQLRVMVDEDRQLEGMGTTLTALLWTGQRLGLVHVGDSRAYLLRGGQLTQITQDHTWVQRLVDEGRITEEEATTHPQRSLLMRALGSGDHVEPDLSIREVRAGDRYLLCSDGLSGVVSHQTMEDTLASYQGPQETVEDLIQLALRGGGPDNITCIVADVLDVGDNDTLTNQLNDTPVIVGAVAENQHQIGAPGALQTPAARAAELGKSSRSEGGESGGEVPAQQSVESGEGFGPPADGARSTAASASGAYGPYGDDDPPAKGRRKGLKWSLWVALAVVLVGGGLYGGYQWTQTQYYVGAKDDHVVLYRGLDQELAGVSLNDVQQDKPSVELKYLPQFKREEVRSTIAVDSLDAGKSKFDELSEHAKVCKRVAEQREGPSKQERKTQKKKETHQKRQHQRQQDPSSGADSTRTPSSNESTDSSTEAPPGEPSFTEKQQELAKQCTAP